jgi:hypothetical protein
MTVAFALFSGVSANAQCQDYYGDVDGCLDLISTSGVSAIYADAWNTHVVSTRSQTPNVTSHYQTNILCVTINTNTGMMSAYGTSASFYCDGILCVYTTLTQTNTLKDVEKSGLIKFTGTWSVFGSFAVPLEGGGTTNAYANVIQNTSNGSLYGSATAGTGGTFPSIMCFYDHFGGDPAPANNGHLCWPEPEPEE